MLSRLSSAKIETTSPQPVGTVWQIFFIWVKIGTQSFGGGTTVAQFIRREMIYKRGWMTELDYTNFWTLCNLVPGVNFIAFAIIIGRKLAGLKGSFACMLGLLLPSAIITALLTAGFVSVREQPVVQAMLKGVVPAIVGITFLFVIQFGQPLFKQGLQEGKISLSVSLLFSASVAMLLGLAGWSAVIVLVLAGLAGGLIFPLLWSKSSQTEGRE